MGKLLQFEANRSSAEKAAVSLNALRHGLRARTVVLPGEPSQDFHRLCDHLEAEWQPQSRTEQFYLEQMAVSQWKLARMEVSEVNVRQRITSALAQMPLLDRLWQAQSRLECSYARAQRELERLQNSRRRQIRQEPKEAAPAPQPDAGVPPAATSPAVSDPHPDGNAASPSVKPDPRTAGQPHKAPSARE